MKRTITIIVLASMFTILTVYAVEPEDSTVIFDTDFALPSIPTGDGSGTPVCIDEVSGLLMAGCDVTITADQIDPTSVQRRVDGVCAEGYSIRVINTDGSVVCEPDTDTTCSLSECVEPGQATITCGTLSLNVRCILDCEPGFEDCSGSCVDLLTDTNNCGDCDNACAIGEDCISGLCIASCVPDCSGLQCGDDGCGGSCGICAIGEDCISGICVASCVPDCSGLQCGDDGCGGSCGICAIGEDCISGICVASCVPDCSGLQCGNDGCGGSCGICAIGEDCISGACVPGG